MSYLTESELQDLGLRAGPDAKVSRDARIFGADRISIGENVRVDAFCVMSAGGSGSVRVGSHVHLASGCRLFGEGGITLADFSSVSAGSTLYSASDDYSGEHLMGPHLPESVTMVDARPIVLERFAAIGAHSLVLPGVTLGEGAVLGAASMASDGLDAWTIYAGCPARSIKQRSRSLVELADRFTEQRRRSEESGRSG